MAAVSALNKWRAQVIARAGIKRQERHVTWSALEQQKLLSILRQCVLNLGDGDSVAQEMARQLKGVKQTKWSPTFRRSLEKIFALHSLRLLPILSTVFAHENSCQMYNPAFCFEYATTAGFHMLYRANYSPTSSPQQPLVSAAPVGVTTDGLSGHWSSTGCGLERKESGSLPL